MHMLTNRYIVCFVMHAVRAAGELRGAIRPRHVRAAATRSAACRQGRFWLCARACVCMRARMRACVSACVYVRVREQRRQRHSSNSSDGSSSDSSSGSSDRDEHRERCERRGRGVAMADA